MLTNNNASAWDAELEMTDGPHEQPWSCAKCDTDKEFKDRKVEIQEKNVGWSGKDCSKIKNYVIDKTFTEVGGDTEASCHEEGEVFARIKAQDAEDLEALRDNVRQHEEIFKEKEKQTESPQTGERLDHDKIGKMIGCGSNIDLLKSRIGGTVWHGINVYVEKVRNTI